jgi:diguanylate cyclase (GGDEF)-like protein/PAS domain S-box-containing protein
MNLDIRTINIALIITNLFQAVAFSFQYFQNKNIKGTKRWALGIILQSLSYFLSIFREIPGLAHPSIFLANCLLILGLLFIYSGVLEYLGLKRSNFIWIGAFFVFILSISYFLFVDDNITVRRVIIAVMIAATSLEISRLLLGRNTQRIRSTATFQGMVFLASALLFIVRIINSITGPLDADEFIATPAQIIFYLGLLAITVLWGIGFILLVNQAIRAEIEETKDRMETILNTSPDSILLTRLVDGFIVDVNEQFTILTGYLRDEVVGKTVGEINLWKNPRDREKLVDCLHHNTRCDNIEATFLRKDGASLTGIMTARVVQLDGIDYITSITHDISDRIEMEKSLRESEEKFRFMAENSGDVVWHMDRNFILDYISPADERIRGYTQKEVLGTSLWDMLKPDDVEIAKKAETKLLEQEGQEYFSGMSTYEFEVNRKDGKSIWVEITTHPHYDIGHKIIGFHGVTREITERKRLQEELRNQAATDVLTGIANRRRFMELFDLEMKRVHRYQTRMSIILMDIDDFKQINDSCGHAVGDVVLKEFADCCQQSIREIDLLARFGGDEFIIMLPQTSVDQAELIAERITKNLEELVVDQNGYTHQVTASMGIAALTQPFETLDDLVKKADEALYKSKNDGKNQSRINKE